MGGIEKTVLLRFRGGTEIELPCDTAAFTDIAGGDGQSTQHLFRFDMAWGLRQAILEGGFDKADLVELAETAYNEVWRLEVEEAR